MYMKAKIKMKFNMINAIKIKKVCLHLKKIQLSIIMEIIIQIYLGIHALQDEKYHKSKNQIFLIKMYYKKNETSFILGCFFCEKKIQKKPLLSAQTKQYFFSLGY